jgi:hypothetical protein
MRKPSKTQKQKQNLISPGIRHPNRTRKYRKPKTTKHHRKGGNMRGTRNKTLYLVTTESPSRPKYPVMRFIFNDGDGIGGITSFEKYLSELAYDIEDQLIALKLNQRNINKSPIALIKKYIINKGMYIPNDFGEQSTAVEHNKNNNNIVLADATIVSDEDDLKKTNIEAELIDSKQSEQSNEPQNKAIVERNKR